MTNTTLEQRLRDAYTASAEAMTPTLEALEALDAADRDEPRQLCVVRSDAVGVPCDRTRRVIALVASLVIVAGATATIGQLTRSRDATRTSADVPADAPSWYQMLRPLLPAGFDHVAVSVIEPTVLFIIFNDDGELLLARISRTAVPDDPSGDGLPKTVDADGTWFDRDGTFNLMTSSGLQVQAGCESDTASCQPDGPLTDAALRQFVSDLAHHTTITELVTESTGRPDAAILDAGVQILSDRLIGETLTFENIGNPAGASHFMQWNAASTSATTDPPFTTLTVVGGVYPAPTTDWRASISTADGVMRIETALLTNGTLVRIATNDPAHLNDIGSTLDELVL